ncbi:MAG: bifunctional phosphoribosylaminoimidazolecarboxamide formyltransferase/IMP cyclohydrolase [Candidatus Riflebacteria bacterium]|nr:bifunctional phosphoribosylaminoimidazolecarboxamide formyltransferase/IMP cyclohydrolase [Candidatus Riflebacteria bacterium]
MEIKIKRALLSVSDKTAIVPLAEALSKFGCEIISTGGTGRLLEKAGVKYTEIEKVTGNPECFGGRIKTISFQIAGGLLFDRENDLAEAEKLNIKPIDMVVCNLYPFRNFYESGAELEALIENIDIGGVTLIRAAAKNFKYVSVVTDPALYPQILDELSNSNGSISYETRYCLMREAFNHTADYDSCVALAMDQKQGINSVRLHFTEGNPLRYGENPHQKAWVFKKSENGAIHRGFRSLHGKELSFNNLIDTNSAIDCIRDAQRPMCSIVKHNNPCGLAEAASIERALELAWESDPVSSFGSIIALNKPVNLKTAKFFNFDSPDRESKKFVEVIIAPSFDAEASEYLSLSKNLRLIEHSFGKSSHAIDYRILDGILLAQEWDEKLLNELELKTQKPLEGITDGLIKFGIKAARQIKSNAIAIVRELEDGSIQLLGMGAGQPNRLESTRLAISRCRENLYREAGEKDFSAEDHFRYEMRHALLISDAFFPFSDNIEECARAGIENIIQPGGSIRDPEIIKTCDRLKIAMVFSGIRHFKH